MKKLLLLTLLLITLLTGCKSSNPQEEIESLLNQINTAESYTEVSTIHMFGSIQITTEYDFVNNLYTEDGNLFQEEKVYWTIEDGNILEEDEECSGEWLWNIDGEFLIGSGDIGTMAIMEQYPDADVEWDYLETCEIIYEPTPLSESGIQIIDTDDYNVEFGEEDGLLFFTYQESAIEGGMVGEVKVTLEDTDNGIRLKLYFEGELAVTVVYSKINETVVTLP